MFVSKEKYNNAIKDLDYYKNLKDSISTNYDILEKILYKLSCRSDEEKHVFALRNILYKGKYFPLHHYESLLKDMIEWDKFLDNTEALKKVNTKS